MFQWNTISIEAVKTGLECFKEIIAVVEDTKLTALYHCHEIDVLLETGKLTITGWIM